MSMYEKAEREYQDLLSKKKIVEQDKAKVHDDDDDDDDDVFMGQYTCLKI